MHEYQSILKFEVLPLCTVEMSLHGAFVQCLMLATLAANKYSVVEGGCLANLHQVENSIFANPVTGGRNRDSLISAFFPTNRPPSLIVEVYYHMNESMVDGDNYSMAAFPSNPDQLPEDPKLSTTNNTVYRFRWNWSPLLLFMEPFQAELLSLYLIRLDTEVAHVTVQPICSNGERNIEDQLPVLILNQVTALVSSYINALL